jgi:hypothetical protein
MRRSRIEANHGPPFLEDLLSSAEAPLSALASLEVPWVVLRTPEQTAAFEELWRIFSSLAATGRASCVGISKAVLLLSDGRIGPALDSQVRSRLAISPPTVARDWLDILEDVGDDIRRWETRNGRLSEVVPAPYSALRYGRLYDMLFGPGL